MYYEEQIINGELCFRSSPDGLWCRVSNRELTERLERYEAFVVAYDKWANDDATFGKLYDKMFEARDKI